MHHRERVQDIVDFVIEPPPLDPRSVAPRDRGPAGKQQQRGPPFNLYLLEERDIDGFAAGDRFAA